jgi:hypothetical protein
MEAASMGIPPTNAITCTIAAFVDLSGLGRSRIYELIDEGVIETIVIGKKRLVVLDSYRRLIDAQRTAAAPDRQQFTPPRRPSLGPVLKEPAPAGMRGSKKRPTRVSTQSSSASAPLVAASRESPSS